MFRLIKNTSFLLSILLISLLFFPLSDLYSSPDNELSTTDNDKEDIPLEDDSGIYLTNTDPSANEANNNDYYPYNSSNSYTNSNVSIIDADTGVVIPNTDNTNITSSSFIDEDPDATEVMQELEDSSTDGSILDLYTRDLVEKKLLNQTETLEIKRFFEGLQEHFNSILEQYGIVPHRQQEQLHSDPFQNLQNLLPDDFKISPQTVDDPNIPILLRIVKREKLTLLSRENIKRDIRSGALNGVKSININPDDTMSYGIKFYYIENSDQTASGILISIRLYLPQNPSQLSYTSYNILLSSDYAAYEHQINTLDTIDNIKSALSFDKELIKTLIEAGYTNSDLEAELEYILSGIYELEEQLSILEKNTKYFISEDKKQFSKELNKILSNLKTLNSCDVVDLAYDPSHDRLIVLSTVKAPKWGTFSYIKQRIRGAMAPAEPVVGIVSTLLQSSLTFLAVYLKYQFDPRLSQVDISYVVKIGYVYALWTSLFAFVVGTYGVTYKNLMDRVSDNYSSESGRFERIVKELIFSIAFAVPMVYLLYGCDDGTGHTMKGITLGWVLNFVAITFLIKCTKDVVFAYFRKIRKLAPQDSTQLESSHSLFKYSRFNLYYQGVYNCLSFFPKILGLLGASFLGVNVGTTSVFGIAGAAMIFNRRWAKGLYSEALRNYFKALLQSEEFENYASFSDYINTVITGKDSFDEEIIQERFGVEAKRSNFKDIIEMNKKYKYVYYWFSSPNKIKERILSNESRYVPIVDKILALTKKIEDTYYETYDISSVEEQISELVDLIIQFDTLMAQDEYLQRLEEDIAKKGNIIDRTVDKIKYVADKVISPCMALFTRCDPK